MNVFFAGSVQGLPRLADTYRTVLDAAKKHGDTVLPSWIVKKLSSSDKGAEDARATLLQQVQLIQQCDVMIAEVSTPSFGIGYLMGQALTHHKPILCMYPKAGDLKLLSDFVKGNTSSLITLQRYDKKNIESITLKFLDSFRGNQLQKFNFVASKEVVEFIRAGAEHENKTQSEFLRDTIKEVIKKTKNS
jgi:hypothetical protein